jgi:hypothetical protein
MATFAADSPLDGAPPMTPTDQDAARIWSELAREMRLMAIDREEAVRTALFNGEWWNAAEPLLEAKRAGDWIEYGSWTAYCEHLPMSRSHAHKIMACGKAGYATPGAALRVEYQRCVKRPKRR